MHIFCQRSYQPLTSVNFHQIFWNVAKGERIALLTIIQMEKARWSDGFSDGQMISNGLWSTECNRTMSTPTRWISRTTASSLWSLALVWAILSNPGQSWVIRQKADSYQAAFPPPDNPSPLPHLSSPDDDIALTVLMVLLQVAPSRKCKVWLDWEYQVGISCSLFTLLEQLFPPGLTNGVF